MNFLAVSVVDASAKVQLGNLDLFNGSQEDTVDFGSRMRDVELLHDRADEFPPTVRKLLLEHRAILKAPRPIQKRAEKVVEELMDETENVAPDYNIDYVYGTDVVQPLKEILNEPRIEEPIPIDAIPPDDVEIRLREAAQWRRIAARGAAGAKFRRMVRDAYNSTCIVCGIRLPASPRCRVPGVDSAHILPWATYDLQVIGNGVCLCKIHHWAFDQQLIAISHKEGQYHVTLTDRAREALGPEAVASLEIHAGPIAQARLPQNRQHCPRPRFLAELYNLTSG